MPTVAVIGASADRRKFGNKSVRAHLRQGYTVYPVNPHEKTVEGVRAYPTIGDIPGPVDRVSMYVPPEIGMKLLGGIAEKRPREFYLNPGSESPELVAEARRLGLAPILACSILELGQRPADFAA